MMYYLSADGEGTATTSTLTSPTATLYVTTYIIDVKIKPFDEDFFSLFWFKDALYKQCVFLNRLFTEHLYRLKIALIFNTRQALFYRRMMFHKSGFLARAGRRKRN